MTTTFPRLLRLNDYWRVNSYGYPCFFSEGEKAQQAWTTFLSFFDFEQYTQLKGYWDSNDAPWKLSSHAVESWKAAFEEFGLVHVKSGSNSISITPGGRQLRAAAEGNNHIDFAWTGLNLLLRYPLRGPRRAKSPSHETSDLLLYRFFYAALLDLDGYLWWSELERIMCRLFVTAEANTVIEDIRELRANPRIISEVDLPVDQRAGGFYNSLNQVIVHAGMNHLLLISENDDCPYGDTESKRKVSVRRDWLGLIRRAMLADDTTALCRSHGSSVARLPAAPSFADEDSYFEYLGAPVISISEASGSTISVVEFQGEGVFVLTHGTHYSTLENNCFTGTVTDLCPLARGQRLILSHDEHWTYIVESKELVSSTMVAIRVRKGRPIINFDVIRDLIGGDDA